MLALICFAISTFFFIVHAVDGSITNDPAAWGFVFQAAGLLFTTLGLPSIRWPWERTQSQ